MPLPHSTEARAYYRAATRRFAEANVLLEESNNSNAYTTGAVYLAGYAIECMFKALIVERTAPRQRTMMIAGFRGVSGHSIESLLERYRKVKGPAIPRDIREHLTRTNSWSTDLRYEARLEEFKVAASFLASVRTIIQWADQRL